MSIYEEIMMLPIKVMQVDIISYSGIIRRIENKYMPGSIRACSLNFRTFHFSLTKSYPFIIITY